MADHVMSERSGGILIMTPQRPVPVLRDQQQIAAERQLLKAEDRSRRSICRIRGATSAGLFQAVSLMVGAPRSNGKT
jgi:hypothetical protein